MIKYSPGIGRRAILKRGSAPTNPMRTRMVTVLEGLSVEPCVYTRRINGDD
jgi:hypothetical protein